MKRQHVQTTHPLLLEEEPTCSYNSPTGLDETHEMLIRSDNTNSDLEEMPICSDKVKADLETEAVVRLSTVVRREYEGKKFIFKTREFSPSHFENASNLSRSRQIENNSPPLDDNIGDNEIILESVKSIFLKNNYHKEVIVIDDELHFSPPSSPTLRENSECSKFSDFNVFNNHNDNTNLVSSNKMQ